MLESRAQIPHEELVVLMGKDVASWQCDGDLSGGRVILCLERVDIGRRFL